MSGLAVLLYDGVGHSAAKSKPRRHQRDVISFLLEAP
jgi:hypothetical protein